VKQLRAIVIQTMRSAIRSRVFHILFLFILLAVFALPIVVSGDGTAKGQAQITLTYSLGVVVALISTTTLWLACSQLPREIEDYTIHMVTTKPCPRWVVWVGKWLGVVIMNGVILAVSALVIFGLVHVSLTRHHFSKAEMDRLKSEVLVGRRAFFPVSKDYVAEARKEYEERKAAGKLEANHSPKAVIDEILRQKKAESTELQAGATKWWRFENVHVPKGTKHLYLRYRHYAGSTSQSSQRLLRGTWIVVDPRAKGYDNKRSQTQQVLSGNFHELDLPADIISDDGVVEIGYLNPAEEKSNETGEDRNTSVIFQLTDGPALLARVSGFTANYARAMMLAFFQIAFLAALGCAVGAAFSTPVAAFVAIAYLVIGLSVQAAVNAPLKNDLGEYEYKGVLDRAAHYLARGVSVVVVSVDDFDATSDLARGRLVEYKRMLDATLNLIVFRGGLIALLGIWVLNRRELGTVIRR
jgi:hypothetical protein